VHCFIDKLFAAIALLRYFSKFFTLRCSCTAAAEFSTEVYCGRIFSKIVLSEYLKFSTAAEFSTKVYSANIFLNLMLCNKV
jgi:hypothetical protein